MIIDGARDKIVSKKSNSSVVETPSVWSPPPIVMPIFGKFIVCFCCAAFCAKSDCAPARKIKKNAINKILRILISKCFFEHIGKLAVLGNFLEIHFVEIFGI